MKRSETCRLISRIRLKASSTTCRPSIADQTGSKVVDHLGVYFFWAESVLMDSNECDRWIYGTHDINYWLGNSMGDFIVEFCGEIPVYGIRTRNTENNGINDRGTKQFRIEVSNDKVRTANATN